MGLQRVEHDWVCTHKKSHIPQSSSLIVTAYLCILVSLQPRSAVSLSIRHSLHASPPLPIQLSSIPHHFNHSFAKTLHYLLLFIASAWCYELNPEWTQLSTFSAPVPKQPRAMRQKSYRTEAVPPVRDWYHLKVKRKYSAGSLGLPSKSVFLYSVYSPALHNNYFKPF